MVVGMKNALGIVDAIKDHFDFAINEECHEWNECNVSATRLTQPLHIRAPATVKGNTPLQVWGSVF